MKHLPKVLFLVLAMMLATALFAACSSGVTAGETQAAATASKTGGETVIGHGQEVDIHNYLAKGKTTIFDFFSEFCPPCRRISPLLKKLDEKRTDIVVVKVDINRKDVQGHIDWQSPVARQYKLQSIPHFMIFSPDGKLEAEGEAAYTKVMNLLQKEKIIS